MSPLNKYILYERGVEREIRVKEKLKKYKRKTRPKNS